MPDDPLPLLGMTADLPPIGLVERALLEQHVVADTELADVVEQRRERDRVELEAFEAELAPDRECDPLHPAGVTGRVGVAGVDRRRERLHRVRRAGAEERVRLDQRLVLVLDDRRRLAQLLGAGLGVLDVVGLGLAHEDERCGEHDQPQSAFEPIGDGEHRRYDAVHGVVDQQPLESLPQDVEPTLLGLDGDHRREEPDVDGVVGDSGHRSQRRVQPHRARQLRVHGGTGESAERQGGGVEHHLLKRRSMHEPLRRAHGDCEQKRGARPEQGGSGERADSADRDRPAVEHVRCEYLAGGDQRHEQRETRNVVARSEHEPGDPRDSAERRDDRDEDPDTPGGGKAVERRLDDRCAYSLAAALRKAHYPLSGRARRRVRRRGRLGRHPAVAQLQSGAESHDPVAPVGLGAVGGDVCAVQQLAGVGCMCGERRDADRDGDPNPFGGRVDCDRCVLDTFSDPLRDHHGGLLGGVEEQDAELLAAEARRHVAGPDVRPEDTGDGREDCVPRKVAVPVVHLPQQVEVRDEQRERLVETASAVERLVERLGEVPRVVQLRLRILPGLCLELRQRERAMEQEERAQREDGQHRGVRPQVREHDADGGEGEVHGKAPEREQATAGKRVAPCEAQHDREQEVLHDDEHERRRDACHEEARVAPVEVRRGHPRDGLERQRGEQARHGIVGDVEGLDHPRVADFDPLRHVLAHDHEGDQLRGQEDRRGHDQAGRQVVGVVQRRHDHEELGHRGSNGQEHGELPLGPRDVLPEARDGDARHGRGADQEDEEGGPGRQAPWLRYRCGGHSTHCHPRQSRRSISFPG